MKEFFITKSFMMNLVVVLTPIKVISLTDKKKIKQNNHAFQLR